MANTEFIVDLFVAFNLGLASQVHCVGMCGGIVASLSLALPPAIQSDPRRLSLYALTYNLGRITSYSAAGFMVGLLGGQFAASFAEAGGHRWLRWLACGVLVLTGLALLRQSGRLTFIEAIGMKVWTKIAPLGRRLLPIRTPARAFLFGILWGGLPCALVYSTLLFAAASASPSHAALIMLAFGFGTLPAVLATTWFASRAGHGLRAHGFRRLAGVLLIAVGLSYPWLGELSHRGHAEHDIHHHDQPQ